MLKAKTIYSEARPCLVRVPIYTLKVKLHTVLKLNNYFNESFKICTLGAFGERDRACTSGKVKEYYLI